MSDAPKLSALPFAVLVKMTADLNDSLDGARLQKIRHRDHGDLVFEFYTATGRRWLRLAALKNGSRIYLLSAKPEASGKDADAFCKTLRERLVPSLLRSISVVGQDRVLRFEFEGPEGRLALIFEAFGRRSNLLLLRDEDRILVGLHGQSIRRDLGPGKTYEAPEAPAMSQDVAVPEPLDALDGEALHEYLAAQWDAGDLAQSSVQRQDQAAKAIRKELKKLRRQQKSLAQDIAKAGDPDHHRAIGHLLAASLHRLKKGMDEIELENPGIEELEPVVMVRLDPKKTPEQNMSRYYRQSKRAQGTREHGARRLKELEGAIQKVEMQLEGVEDGNQGLIEAFAPDEAPTKTKRTKGPVQRTGVARYAFVHEIEGGVIWIGRNAAGNDEILRQYARGNDLWFHARDGAGSHVFLRAEGRNPSPDEIRQAARMAALHSSLKKEATVDVLWTECKHIRKPKGAPAGQVQVANGKTIRVSTK
jgi:predicted ribosome quality control (RQC) complex YloA/Tae2 family protein